MLMGFFDMEALHTHEHHELLTSFPEHIVTPTRYWLQLGGRHGNQNVSLMTDTVHRFIHALVSHSIAGQDDCIGKVTITDLFILYSIFERVPIHLGYVLADYLVHQGTHTRLKTITTGTYITRLIIEVDLVSTSPDSSQAPTSWKSIGTPN
ncbi:hypothetical protein J5N97_009925 [Dioscorea zingiberensis]|uniref:Uncharacterized protein n=1 Tax=Dioscorea zingiberensis TaxID=325984 RepID=A0A9D5D0E4_9LILI|nr:hypothetical protein J5N97_009925 [Dioscorea zingiberensis]